MYIEPVGKQSQGWPYVCVIKIKRVIIFSQTDNGWC